MALGFPPAFFVVGAPRCGTTTLVKSLRTHPGISFSRPKEANAFLIDAGEPVEALRRRYLAAFHPDLGAQHLAVGDGSVMYLYRPETIERALRFDPRARFLVSVRSPLDMLPSYHARMVYLLDEEEPDFATAWRLRERRRQGGDLPKGCRDARLLDYEDVGSLGLHVARLFEQVGRERCHVVVFEDLLMNQQRTYRRVLAFLGLPQAGKLRKGWRRRNLGFRSRTLQRVATNRFPGQARLAAADPRLRAVLGSLRRRVKRFNSVEQARRPLSPGLRAELRAHFREDVEHLAKLLDRDLDHWLRDG